jgi:hypothetical protein
MISTISNKLKSICNLVFDYFIYLLRFLSYVLYLFIIEIPFLIYDYFTLEILFLFLYSSMSIAEVGALTTNILYLTKCNLSDSDINSIVFNLVFVGIILLKRFICFITSSSRFHRNRPIQYLKLVIHMFLPLLTHITQLIIYNRIDITNNCSIRVTNNDRNVIQLIIGLMVSIYETEWFYHCNISNRRNINSRISNTTVVPIQIIVETNTEQQNKSELVEKINKLESITSIQNEQGCSICLITDDSPIIILSNCTHSYHKECILQWINQDIKTSINCPICRTLI